MWTPCGSPVTVRGYRMNDVDDVLDRLGAELAERDARIAELEAALAGAHAAAMGGPGLITGRPGPCSGRSRETRSGPAGPAPRSTAGDTRSARDGPGRRGAGMSGVVTEPDGLPRCPWGMESAQMADYRAYHDTEWGLPVHGDDALFERMSLEAFQSGLSWITILRRRPGFRAAFAGFRIAEVARFTDADAERLLADPGIIRNRAKIAATINNARSPPSWPRGELDALIWSYAPDRAGRPVPRTDQRCPAGDPGVDGARQGPQEARLPLRRPDHRVRDDAGVRPGQRPPGGLPCPRGPWKRRPAEPGAAGRPAAAGRMAAGLSGPGRPASPSSRTPRPRCGGPPRPRPAPWSSSSLPRVSASECPAP